MIINIYYFKTFVDLFLLSESKSIMVAISPIRTRIFHLLRFISDNLNYHLTKSQLANKLSSD